MNSHLGANRMLELLGQLRDTVREFATREEALRTDFKARAGKLARQCETENAALITQTATETSTAEVNFQVARDTLELEYERRTARIERATKTAASATTRPLRKNGTGRNLPSSATSSRPTATGMRRCNRPKRSRPNSPAS